MRSLATREAISFNFYYPIAKRSISLNYREFKCLEMALYFLTEQCYAQYPHFAFTQFNRQALRSLNQWLNKPKLSRQLRSKHQIDVAWPIDLDQHDDLKWLGLALEVGITEDTVLLMAADEANYARDMALQYAKTDEDYHAADDAFYLHYQEFRHYYSDIAQCSSPLLAKFRDILEF